ncbi:phage tail domain-containing protein, partial [Staphylococcus capitis]|uniref:phage tail domain-containing protein n=1 Tax=Staphylococcus capitis TaxID=29388 RepID=UPI00066EC97F
IFNGKHTRDFNVTNVNVDTGLAEDTFLANRSLITERTRYSDKSYLLGINDEPLQFKIRLLFDEHKFTNDNIRALKRWLHTDTFKEFVFDNEEESSIKVIFYAMVVDTSTL